MKRTLIAFLSFIIATPAFAEIKGKVVDARGQPVYNAKVALYEKGNQEAISSTNTTFDGTFYIADYDFDDGKHYLNIGKDGFDTTQIDKSKDLSEDDITLYSSLEPTTPTTATQPNDQGTESQNDKINEQEVSNISQDTKFMNNLVDAAGIGATGIGGMMAASALTEQYYDEIAENEMREYVGKFRCDYGTGTTVVGGTFNNDLPGGNELIDLYTQYATLANDLKIRKDALGLKPGIESEVIIDKAESGLYDNAATGVTGGNYASIARAIQDPTGTDAQKWKSQLNETSDHLETGATVAGVGAIGSAYLNIKNNSSDQLLVVSVQSLRSLGTACGDV